MELRNGPGRPLTFLYGLFAVAATARAAVQLATKYSDAPVAYLLSALAGLVYIAAAYALVRDDRRLAWATISVELTGVLVVGTLSYADSSAFPDQTVWSGYGSGYGYVPLVLPVLGLLWLRRSGRPGR